MNNDTPQNAKRGRGRPNGLPKSGGRKKGTPNKITKEMRIWLGELLVGQLQQIEKDFSFLNPYQRLTMFEKLMQYVIPRKQSARVEVRDLTEAELTDLATLMIEQMK